MPTAARTDVPAQVVAHRSFATGKSNNLISAATGHVTLEEEETALEPESAPEAGRSIDQSVLPLRGGGNDDRKDASRSQSEGCCLFTCILLNVRSLQTEERLEELMQEAQGVQWDVILVNESWRQEREGILKLKGGHKWLGSGGCLGKHGVGILLHSRWAQTFLMFRAVSRRVSLVRLKAGTKILSIICVYMPHCGYPDEDVENMYTELSQLLAQERLQGHLIIGD
jgi:hypothetical protein